MFSYEKKYDDSYDEIVYEGNLFIDSKFKKDFEKIKDVNVKQSIRTILEELSQLLKNNPDKVSNYLKTKSSKKFKSVENLWKFYVNSCQRIIYCWGNKLVEGKYRDSILILRYVSQHDRQGVTAKNTRIEDNYYKDDIYHADLEEQEDLQVLGNLENLKSDNQIIYYALPGKIKRILMEPHPKVGVLLNSEQYNCINSEVPLIVKGNAGSGKTLVSIELMKLLQIERVKSLYLTYTNGLSNAVKNEYTIQTGIENSNFYSIHGYCLNETGIMHNQYVEFSGFKNWYGNLYNEFESIEVWTEIRGIIKGYMGNSWQREISLLSPMISCNDYLELSEEKSKFNLENRKKIYNIAEKYQEWLESDEQRKYDDNDLSRKLYEKICNMDIERFDGIVVDEVQDLTECQIAVLFELVKNNNIYLCGDPNQIINPTLFSFARITDLIYLKQKKSIKQYTLKKNYRSSRKIVDYINELTNLRIKYIGRQKIEDDDGEVALREDSSLEERIFMVECIDKNIKKIIEVYNSVPSTAIIVSDKKTKKDLEKLVGEDELSCIYTIHEIKGLEFNNIMCYKLFTDNKIFWSDILQYRGRKDSKYRFYFNLYYVAITRAREYVFILEDSNDATLLNLCNIKSGFVKEVTQENLKINNDILAEEWFKDGEKFEIMEDYDRAINAYMQATIILGEKCSVNAERCKAKKFYKEKKYKEAGDKFFELGDFESAKKSYEEINDDIKKLRCILRSNENDSRENLKLDINLICNCIISTEADDKLIKDIEKYYLLPLMSEHKDNCQFIKESIIPEIKGETK